MIVNAVRHIRSWVGILSLDTIIIYPGLSSGMKQHALRTAMTLYQGGTLDVETAAKQAGVSPQRLQRAIERTGGSVSVPSVEPERLPVGAD
jgi:hypothetical protein